MRIIALVSLFAVSCSSDETTDRPGGEENPPPPTWVFEAEDEVNHGCGEIAGCAGGVGTDCWHTNATLCPAGGNIAYGPYTTELALGTYEATWRIRADTAGMQPADAVMTLDVFAAPDLHAARTLTAADFPSPDAFVEFSLTFMLQSARPVELRSSYPVAGTYAEIWVDKVTVREAAELEWVFEAEDDLSHLCGEIANDCDGAGTGCWYADDLLCTTDATFSYGPYLAPVPYGTYEITWRMKADTAGLAPTDRVFRLGAAINPIAYGVRILTAADFPSAGTFYEFPMTVLVQAFGDWEFTAWYEDAINRPEVWLDEISVVPVAPLTEWVFQAEDPFTAGHVCGELASDCDGTGVDCWRGDSSLCAANQALVFGPYTYQLPIGSFVATFRIKADTAALTGTDEVLRLDAANPTVLGETTLTAADFPSASQFYEFTVSFDQAGPPAQLELRVAYATSLPEVWVDEVVVVPAP